VADSVSPTSVSTPIDATTPTEVRPWGYFVVLADLPHCKVKRLVINPGHRLSLQLHHQREEHWTVVRGQPTVTVGDSTWQTETNEHILIPQETKHRIANEGPGEAEIIEVQMGQYFGEDDIVRFEDDYQRI